MQVVLVYLLPFRRNSLLKRASQSKIMKNLLKLLISPPENDSFRKDLCFTADVLFIFFLHSRNLRDAWADRREIVHDGQ